MSFTLASTARTQINQFYSIKYKNISWQWDKVFIFFSTISYFNHRALFVVSALESKIFKDFYVKI